MTEPSKPSTEGLGAIELREGAIWLCVRDEGLRGLSWKPVLSFEQLQQAIHAVSAESGEPPTEILDAARKWINEHRPEPAKCVNCGKPYEMSTGPMASGTIWLDPCPQSPQSGHVYEFTIGGEDEREAARLADFASACVSRALAQQNEYALKVFHEMSAILDFAGTEDIYKLTNRLRQFVEEKQQAESRIAELGRILREIGNAVGAPLPDYYGAGPQREAFLNTARTISGLCAAALKEKQ